MQNSSKGMIRLAAAMAGAALAFGLSSAATAQNRTVIELTQVACQFLESENGVDHDYTTTKKADCERINAQTGEERLKAAEVIRLPAGDYTFRVTNVDVPYQLGFWLRGDGAIGRATLPSVSGGGLTAGKSRDYNITLKPGEYLYSCPLNTTPDYALIVQ